VNPVPFVYRLAVVFVVLGVLMILTQAILIDSLTCRAFSCAPVGNSGLLSIGAGIVTALLGFLAGVR